MMFPVDAIIETLSTRADARGGRHHRDRHAGRRRLRPHAAGVPPGWRRARDRGRGDRRDAEPHPTDRRLRRLRRHAPRDTERRGSGFLCSVPLVRVVTRVAISVGEAMTDDVRAIRETVENWALWRDAGDWARFATVWHDDGWMTATWFQGPASKFIEVTREGFDRGVSILHFLGGTTCDVAGAAAIAQTKMTINQRATVDRCVVDVVCTGRFYDFFEKRQERWAHRAAAADLREGPHGPGRSRGPADARRVAAGAVSGRVPAPRLPAVEERITRSRRACPVSAATRSRSCMPRARPGSPDRRSLATLSRNRQDDAQRTGCAHGDVQPTAIRSTAREPVPGSRTSHYRNPT